jgi:hypothetical protein
MKPYLITVINAITLIAMGLWGYFGSGNPSVTALIPVFAGVIFLVLSRGIKTANKTVAHITVLLTLLVWIALVKPLSGGISRNDPVSIARVMVMMLTCALALFFYIKSFIDIRRQRS